MSIFDNVRSGLLNFLFPGDAGFTSQRIQDLQARRDYEAGKHRQTIRVRPGKSDDNIYLNFCGLIVDRSVSLLFGKGIEFDLPGDGNDTPADQYINAVWEANKKKLFLHKLAKMASTDGTGYIKIIPDALPDGLPRLVRLDGKLMEIVTNPDDIDDVIGYRIQWVIQDPVSGKEIAKKQEHTKQENGFWLVEDFEASAMSGGRWQLVNAEEWPYEFPQILNFQNLPAELDIYGDSDISDDLMRLQDKINFTASNIGKIIRLHAHPMLYTSLGSAQADTFNTGIGEMIGGVGKDGFIKSVEMASDLTSSQEFFRILRQALFDIARSVDIDSVSDKLGAMTNFALRVLYQDAINKLETKRELYGDALLELNRRLLVIQGMPDDPGSIIWPDALPVNGADLSNELKADIEMGILSKQSAANEKGYDWENEQERMADEEMNNGDITAALLTNFERGNQ